MNWKGFGRKHSWPNLRYYPGIFLEELRKAMFKTLVRIAGVLAEIEDGNLLNRSQKYYYLRASLFCYPHVTALNLLNGFWLNLILEGYTIYLWLMLVKCTNFTRSSNQTSLSLKKIIPSK
jgi:hypothetical protein